MKRNDQRGIAHIVEIVIIAVVVLGVAGFIAWRMWGTNNNNQASKNDVLQQAIAKAQCTGLNDKDLCKFFTSFNTQKYSTVTSTTVADGKTSTSKYQADGNNYHITLTGDLNYEAISIGQDLYIKNGNTWWKQTIPPTDTSKYNLSTNSDVTFTEPSKDSASTEPSYQKQDNEKCGNATCFKYQLLDPTNPSEVTYIWFDTVDYQLRRMQMTGTDSTSTDSTFDYAKVTVSVPSSVQTLAPNQYILPGQSEPVTLPSQSDLDNMLNNM